MAALTQEQREANLISTAQMALVQLRDADYRTRRRGVMYVATVLGHRMGLQELRDQPWGTVGQCANCGQIAKAPRHAAGIEGRAATTICPSGRDST